MVFFFGACTTTCGIGQQSRTRTCDNPVPVNNGAFCQGPGSEYTSCTLPACPGDYIFQLFRIYHLRISFKYKPLYL